MQNEIRWIDRQGQPDREAKPIGQITRGLMDHVEMIARACGATAIFVYADALRGRRLPISDRFAGKVFYVVKSAEEERMQAAQLLATIRVPHVPLTRMGQVKIAVFIALLRRIVTKGDMIVCLTGTPNTPTLDTLSVVDVGGEFEMLVSFDASLLPRDVQPEVIERVLDLATQLGSEGREGKPVGALFVIGDCENVLTHSYQLILNPFRGYSENERNVQDPRLEETVKELASLDGAFLIRGDGVIETCGACLETFRHQVEEHLPPGLGARHYAAAAITALSDCMAVTVSESTGTVVVFRSGKIVTMIKRPRIPVLTRHFEPPLRPREPYYPEF